MSASDQQSKLMVFFIDDDADILDLFKLKFSQEICEGRIEMACYTNGCHAFDDIISGGFQNVDVVVTDLNMPGMSGVDFVTEIKALYPNVRVYMVSGVKDGEAIEAAIHFGAQGYFTKPLDFDKIKRCLFKPNTETLKKELKKNLA